MTHPSVEALRLFLAGDLEEAQRNAIETHLEWCKIICPKELDRLTAGEAPPPVPPDEDEDEAFPFTPDGYEILGKPKKGGMGIVYLAEDLRLNCRVALKRVRHADASRQLRERFRLEARAMARLSHPNIVRIYCVPEQAGQPFFVMEYLEGGDLLTRLKAGLPPSADAARLLEDLARALHFAHQHGVIHRDLKPENVLLAAPSSWTAARVKISDFGLARILEDESTCLSRSNQVGGTPNYMSPEQAAGKREEVSTLSDVYGLGAVLYKMLTGHAPYEGANVFEILDKIKNEAPVRPRQWRSDIPADLELICLKCLERERGRRYASAEQLADELRRFLDNRPLIYTRPVGPAERLWLWARRKPAWAVAAGLALAVLLVLVAGSIAFTVQESHRLAAADAAKEKINESLQEANLRLSERHLEAGLSLCAQGKVGVGLLQLAEALRSAPPAADELARVIRANLAGWGRQVGPLRGYLTHPRGARAVAFSPDGKTVMTGGADGTARPWDAQTCQPAGKPLNHGGPVDVVAFSPDGTRVATAGPDGTTRLWDSFGRSLAQCRHGSAVLALAFGPSGRRLLTGGADGFARLWDTETGKPVGKSLRHGPAVYAVGFSPNGQKVATAGDGLARVWEVATGAPAGKALPHSGRVRALAFGSGSVTLLTGCSDATARLWDVVSCEALGPPLRHRRSVLAVGFAGGGRVATASADGVARLWEEKTGRAVGQPFAHAGDARALALGPGGKKVVTVGVDGSTRLWDAVSGMPVLAHFGNVRAVAFSPDGRTVLTGSWDRTAQFWDATSGQPLGPVLKGHEHAIHCVAFSPDGRLAATGSWDKTARLWEVASGTPLPNVPPLRHRRAVLAVTFSPDGKRVATASSDGTARLWDAASGADLGRTFEHAGGAGVVAFHPGGRLLLTAGADQAARIWDTSSGKPVAAFLGHRGTVLRAAFSPDGEKVVTGSTDGTARLWEVPSGKLLGEPLQHGAEVRVAVFSPDGHTVLTGSDDGTACLSDAASGRPRLWLSHRNAVRAGALSPDGRVVLTGSTDRTAQFWDAASGRSLGPPLEHAGEVWTVAFHPDGHTVLTGSDAREARLWPRAAAIAGDAARIRRWAQVLTGMELEPGGNARFLDPHEWAGRRQQPPRGDGP